MADDKKPNLMVRGTPKELVAIGADLAEHGSCCTPKVENGVVVVKGCAFYRGYRQVQGDPDSPFLVCQLRKWRDKDWRGMGPLNVGVHEAKRIFNSRGKPMHRLVAKTMTCFYLPDRVAHLQQNKGALKIVAMEGEEMLLPQSKRVPALKVGEPDTMETESVKQVVPKFPRPGEDQNLPDVKAAADLVREARLIQDNDDFSRVFPEEPMETTAEQILEMGDGSSG